MKKRRVPLFLVFLVSIAGLPLRAQEKSLEELLALDMTDLLKLKVVSVLKGPETINKVPATVRVITADEIRDNGYFTLEDALADLPGVQFRNILGFNSYVAMRGVPGQNNKILVLVDGIQVNELNSGGFYGGGQFNLANVDRIEVVFGPASAFTAPTPFPASSASSPGIPRTRRAAGPRSWPGTSGRAWPISGTPLTTRKPTSGSPSPPCTSKATRRT